MTLRRAGLALGVILMFGAFSCPAFAAPPSVISQSVGVCSYNNPQFCVRPNSDGSLNLAPTGKNVSDTPTIQNASYVSGNCMGGFRTISLGTTQSVLSQVELASKGGLATAKQVYLFSANPTGSTCTDKSTFTLAAADVSKVLWTGSIVPSAPTGTTVSVGSATNLSLGIPSGGVIYGAIVETATETPASTTDLVENFSAY